MLATAMTEVLEQNEKILRELKCAGDMRMWSRALEVAWRRLSLVCAVVMFSIELF